MARLQLGDRMVDLDTGEVPGHGTLRPTERALLAALAAQPDRLFSLDDLHVEVWGYSPTVSSRAAYSCIYRLRAMIEADPKRPVHLVAERAEGYRLVGAKLQSAQASLLATNAPASVDPFFGRADALDAVTLGDRQDRCLLLTLVGPGGVGKTRLASEAALACTLPGGAWIADLVAATRAPEVCARVAAVLPSRPGPDAEAIGRALVELGPCWLVLDNAEDALEPVAALVRGWAAAAPDCRLIATSRQRLGLRGERVCEVAPLPDAAAAELLLDRVRRRSPSMAASLDRDEVAALVAATDGLPLAIEVAAANVALVGVRPVLAALRNAATLVARTSADAPERHRALDTVVEDSWSRLGPSRQELLATLASFDGAVGFDAIEALGMDDAAECLAALVDAALVAVDVRPGRPLAWRTLVTVRTLVRRVHPIDTEPIFERLAARLEAHWNEGFLPDRVPATIVPRYAPAVSIAVAKQLAAWSRSRHAPARHAVLLTVLVSVAYHHADYESCEQWIAEALALGPEAVHRAELHRNRALIAQFRTDLDAALPAWKEAFDAALAAGRPGLAAQVLYEAGGVLARSDRRAETIETIRQLRETLTALPPAARACGEGGALTLECRLAEHEGDLVRYDRLAALAVAAYVRGGDPVQAARMIGWRAMASLLRERVVEAERALDTSIETLEASRTARHGVILGSQYEMRGWALRTMGRFAQAHVAYRRAVELMLGGRDVLSFVPILFEEGLALVDLGRIDEAVDRFETAMRYPSFDVNARARKAMVRIVHRALTAGEPAAILLATETTAETERVPATLGLYFRHLEARYRLGRGDVRGALAAIGSVVLPPGLREPVSDVLLLRAELQLRLRRRDAGRSDLDLLTAFGPGPQTRAHIAALRRLMAAIDGAPLVEEEEEPPAAYTDWRTGGWIALAHAWTRRVHTGEAPRLDAVITTPLLPDLRWALEEAAAGTTPLWLER